MQRFHRRRPFLWLAAAALPLLAACAQPSATTPPQTAPPAPVIAPDAAAALRRMSGTLGQARSLAVRVEVLREVALDTGGIATLSATQTLVARRPDRFRADLRGDAIVANAHFDGRQVIVNVPADNYYAAADVAPPTIDAALDLLVDRLGVPIPLAGILRSDPYARVTEGASGTLLSETAIAGTPALHLAMRSGDALAWEIWLERDGRGLPLLASLVRDGRRTLYRFTDWRINPTVGDAVFRFDPAPGARRIPFVPLKESAR